MNSVYKISFCSGWLRPCKFYSTLYRWSFQVCNSCAFLCFTIYIVCCQSWIHLAIFVFAVCKYPVIVVITCKCFYINKRCLRCHTDITILVTASADSINQVSFCVLHFTPCKFYLTYWRRCFQVFYCCKSFFFNYDFLSCRINNFLSIWWCYGCCINNFSFFCISCFFDCFTINLNFWCLNMCCIICTCKCCCCCPLTIFFFPVWPYRIAVFVTKFCNCYFFCLFCKYSIIICWCYCCYINIFSCFFTCRCFICICIFYYRYGYIFLNFSTYGTLHFINCYWSAFFLICLITCDVSIIIFNCSCIPVEFYITICMLSCFAFYFCRY